MVTGTGAGQPGAPQRRSGRFSALDYRVYAPDQDGQTKNDPLLALFDQAVVEGKRLARTILVDSCTRAAPIRSDFTARSGRFSPPWKATGWGAWLKKAATGASTRGSRRPQGWSQVEEMRLKEAPFRVGLFTRVATNGGIEWVVTNHLAAHLTRELVIEAVLARWRVAAFHRSFKHLAGWEKCPCQRVTAQRNHRTCCCLARASPRQHACRMGQIIYQAHQQQWAPCLRQLLQKPLIQVLV